MSEQVTVTTIEKTGKKWKRLYLISVGLIVAAVFSGFTAIPQLIPLFLMAAVVVYFVARVGAWWNHG